MHSLSQKDILEALASLSTLLSTQNIRGEICLFGGVAMVLAFQARQSTKDIDAIFAPTDSIRKMIDLIGEEKGWEKGWFNDGVKRFISNNHHTTRFNLPQFPYLNVTMPVPEYLFSMKCMAARIGISESQDEADARLLCHHLNLKSPEEAFKIVESYYPKHQIPPKTQYFIESFFEDIP